MDRTASTLLSVTIVVAGFLTSVLARSDVGDLLGCAALIGGILFAAATVGVTVCTVVAAWPVKTDMALGASKILQNYYYPQHPGRTPMWVHENLAKNMDEAYDRVDSVLGFRTSVYRSSLLCAPVVLLGAGIVVLDVIF